MPVEIRVPQLGDSVVEATVGRWLKQPGDSVAAGDPLVDLETDKVNLTVSAEQDGVLADITRQEGENVAVGDLLGALSAPGDVNGSGKANGSVSAKMPVQEKSAGSDITPQAVSPAEATLLSSTIPPAEIPAHGASSPSPSLEKLSRSVPPAKPLEETRQSPEEHDSPEEDGPRSGALVSPMARRLAEENHLDLRKVKGAGPSGRVTMADVADYIENRETAPVTTEALGHQAVEAPSVSRLTPSPPSSPSTPTVSPASHPATPASHPATPASHPATPASRPVAPAPRPAAPAMPHAPSAMPTLGPVPSSGREEERVKMTRRRATIARRLVEAQHNAAMLTTFNEVDMSAVMELRKARRDAFKERYGVSLGFMSFFTRATVGALKAFPRLNAEIQGDEIVLKRYYDIGVAVSTEEGLVVPVLRDADRKSFADIEKEIADLATRARSGGLTLNELQGGTFTLTNGGVFGSLLSTPILNAPQVGILGMHKIEERPIAKDGQVVIRPMMYLALSYDHRIVDGSEAVRFLVRLKEMIEDPTTLLLEG